jgi:quinol monooxygenase YgiN
MIFYVDKSEVRPGALDALQPAIEELAEFIEANVPPVLAYNVYLDHDRSGMTVVHIHRDSASLEYHLEVGGPAFRKLADLVTLRSIEVYGRPSEAAVERLNDKARMLGGGTVAVHEWRAGFVRLDARSGTEY